MQRSLALSLAVLLLVAPLAGAATAAGSGFSIAVETYNVTFTSQVIQKSVSIPANGSISINITKPAGFWSNHTAYMVVAVSNVTSNIQLAAYAGAQQVAQATVVPLSSAYTQTLPPNTDKITLSSGAVANATVTVYLVSDSVQFKLSLNKTSVTLQRGGHAEIGLTLEQVSGGPVYVWPTVQADYPLLANVYYIDANGHRVPWNSQTAPVSKGSGWKQNGLTTIDWPEDGTAKSNTAHVRIYFYADPNGVNPESAQLVAAVELSGPMTGNVANLASQHNVSAKTLGIGIIALFALFLLFSGGGKHGRGRRGSLAGSPLLLLLLLAALAIGLGLIHVNLSVGNIDWKMLGLGIVALLLFLMMAKPAAFRKAARRIGL